MCLEDSGGKIYIIAFPHLLIFTTNVTVEVSFLVGKQRMAVEKYFRQSFTK